MLLRSTSFAGLSVVITLLLASPLLADWVDLNDGAVLRGVDLKEEGGIYQFTLDDGRRVLVQKNLVAAVRKSSPGEVVEFRGQSVTLREKVRLLKEEAHRRELEAVRLIEKWARGKDGADPAREGFASLPAGDQPRFLAAALAGSTVREARILAAKELARHQGRLAATALARASVTDVAAAVRARSLSSLNLLEDPAAGDLFIPFLASPVPERRLRAAQALERFPSRRAVPVLIETLRFAWTDFGRAVFFQGEQRAYIRDWELVSGGTGFSVVEVADPVIDTVSTGVVLDVKVRKVEVEARVRALRAITGEDFGADVQQWRQWWRNHGAEPLEVPASGAAPSQSTRK